VIISAPASPSSSLAKASTLSKISFVIISSSNINIHDGDHGQCRPSTALSSSRTYRQRRYHNKNYFISSISSLTSSSSLISSSSSVGPTTKKYNGDDGNSAGEGYNDEDIHLIVKQPQNPKKGRRILKRSSSSSLTMEGAVSGSGYWIDKNDPFVIDMNGGELYATGGDPRHQDNISSSLDSAGLAYLTQQQHDESQIMNDDIKGNGKNDKIIDERTNLSSTHKKRIKFTIRGNPRVLIRHRSARGYTYNPSRPAQDDFRNCLIQLLPPNIAFHPDVTRTTTAITSHTKSKINIVDDGSLCYDDENNDNYHATHGMDPSSSSSLVSSTSSSPTTLFSQEECLKLTITFRMKRPKSHFIANQPGHNRLKPSAPSKLNIRNLRSDIDNMAKFVMDSLNGLLYVDDRQVVVLNVRKVLDCDELCLGATDVEICVVNEDEEDSLFSGVDG
jgi:Holliday junction resolvase RusA-like endonuclease